MIYVSKEKGIYFSENIIKIFANDKAVYFCLKEYKLEKIKEFESNQEVEVFMSELALEIASCEAQKTKMICLDDIYHHCFFRTHL